MRQSHVDEDMLSMIAQLVEVMKRRSLMVREIVLHRLKIEFDI